jgi:addiction module antitoxin, relB/dinJ family
MSTVPTQIRIDRNIKEQAGALFSGLGLDMSGAVNMFLHQCVLRGGIPFSIEMPHYKQSALAAMEEARKISRDPNVPSYDNMDDLKRALEE